MLIEMINCLWNNFIFTVWGWVCLVRDRECVDHISRQLAKEPQNHSTLPHQYVRSQQWPQSLALCKWTRYLLYVPYLVFHSVQCPPLPPHVSWLSHVCPQVKRVVVYLGRDKTMQLLEELMCELELTDPVSSAVTHMDNPPYYRITSSYKIPSVTSG